MGEGDQPLLSLPAVLTSLLSPLDSIANGWSGPPALGSIPAIDVREQTFHLYHRLTNLSLFDVHVSGLTPHTFSLTLLTSLLSCPSPSPSSLSDLPFSLLGARDAPARVA